ncbi:MAG: PRD domain-containing protein [Coriobacteriia bacterium]|nr:PRD domain-containing protein [Coriobacteriia bacterium]
MLNKDNLKTRVNILKDADIISEEIANFAYQVIEELDDSYSDDMCEMFTTHLVMALSRVEKNEPVETLDPIIFEEVKQNEHFKDAQLNYDKLMKDSKYALPEQEKEFLLMHLTNLLENQ